MAVRILVADDNPATRELMQDLLELEGYTVYACPDGLQAVESARLLQPDLVLMDIHMPQLDGIEAARRLHQDPATRSIPVVALSAGTGLKERHNAIEAGCIDQVIKPIDMDRLPDQLARWLGAGRMYAVAA